MSSRKKTQFIVRSAVEEDIERCLRLNHSLETQTIWQLQLQEDSERTQISFQTLRLPRPIRVEYPRDQDELKIELGDPQYILVAEADAVLLGYVHVHLTLSDPSTRVRNLVVDEPWRGRQIGRALFEQARKWAKLRQTCQITLETTLRSYPAIRFMTKQGLQFCGFSDRYYTNQNSAVFFGQAI